MGVKSFYAQKLSPLIRALPGGERVDMALVAFNANLQFISSLYANSGSRIFTDEQIDEIFDGIDPASLHLAKRFMHRQYRCPPNALMAHPKYFYEPDEKAEYLRVRPEFLRAVRRYHLPKHKLGPESLYYHHGLRFAPEAVKRRIAGGIFCDIGGWLGDSTLVFQNYAPLKTVIFEPDGKIRDELVGFLKRNRVAAERYDLLPLALSDAAGNCGGMMTRKLDDVTSGWSAPSTVLKADIEGMGLRFLKGAEATIRRDRPLLSLAIYHNEDEFAGIYKTLRGWDIDYRCEIRQFAPFLPHGELSLLAYPREWNEN